MTDINELQRRIVAAMDRVAGGLDRIAAAPGPADPDLAQALEDERTANAQLTERVRVLNEKSQAELGALRAQLEEGQSRIAQLDVDLQRLRRANAQLAENAEALRQANLEGVAEPHLINKAMSAELESLRAARAADMAENAAILSALHPLLETAGTATDEETT